MTEVVDCSGASSGRGERSEEGRKQHPASRAVVRALMTGISERAWLGVDDLPVNTAFKFFLRKWHVLLAVLLIITGLVVPLVVGTFEVAATIIGGAAALIFFVQKQSLEELKLCKEVFKEYNEKYALMSDQLLPFLITPNLSLTPERMAILNRYMNLCAEEYMFYKQGLVLPDVWAAWRRGMLLYFTSDSVRKFLSNERSTGSLYGFDPRAWWERLSDQAKDTIERDAAQYREMLGRMAVGVSEATTVATVPIAVTEPELLVDSVRDGASV